MADKVTEMLDRFTALAQQEKQLSADTDSIYKEYNDYLKSCDEDLNKKIEEIRAKMSKLDYYQNYAMEHARASELEAATEPFETDEGHLESIRQTIKLDSHDDPNAESLYTKVTGMRLYYEQKIEETRHLIEGSKVQAKRQYDADIDNLNRRKEEQDNNVREYIRSDEFKDYLRLLTFDKSAFNSTGTAKIPENSTISLGQRRVRLTVPMDIEQDLVFISNNEYNAGARTIGAPFRISLTRGGVAYFDFDERNKQYLLGGIQRLLLNAVKYFGQNLEDVLFCNPESFNPDCLGHIAALGRGAYPFVIIPNSAGEIEHRVEEYFADIERYPSSDAVSRIVVMHCFPEKYSDDVRERVLNLCKNAEKYGVLVVLTHYNAEDEGDVGAEIREMGISVRSKNGGFWVERLRESLFWYSAPSDIPMEIRRDFVDNRRPKPKPEPIPEPVKSVEPEIPEELEILEEPIPEIEEVIEEQIPEPVADMFGEMNEPEPAEEVAPEPAADMFGEMNEPEPVEETAPEPVADMFGDMNQPEPTEEITPEPVADMFEDMNEPNPAEEITPEPVSDMFGDMNEPNPAEELAPEPVADMFGEMNQPEPVEETAPEPVADMFGDMNQPEPVEEIAPEPVTDVFGDMNEPEPAEEIAPEPVADMFEDMNQPEPVEEIVPEPVQENIPAHILFANQPKPEEKDVTITPVVEIHETLPPSEVIPSPEPVAEQHPAPETAEESAPETIIESTKEPEREVPAEPVNTEFAAKCTRKLPIIGLGLDVNEDPVTFDISGNVTYICGMPCAERRRLIDAIMSTIICGLHPDDMELWMFDCGGEELLRYAENAAPHIRYLVDDASAETTFDLIDTLDSEMSRRAEMFAENRWKTFADVPANVYLPQMMVVVNDFPRMLANMETAPKFFGRNCIDKAKDMFKKCDDYGIHFLLIGETFAVNDSRPACFEGYKIHSGAAVSGCDDGVQTLFASLRLYENEIASLKRIPENCAFVADINSTDGLTLVRFTGKLPEFDKRYRAVAEYTENPAEYVDKHAIVGDKRDAVTFEERRPVREKLLAERAEGEIMMFLGEPCRFMSQYPVRLCEDFGENVLAVMPRREQQVGLAVIMSALRSLTEQGTVVEIIASRSNPIYTELCTLGIPDGVKVYESEHGVERICEIAQQIADENVSKSVEIVLGGDLIFAAMHAEDKIGDLKSALVKGARYGVHFVFTTTSVSQMSSGFLSMFRHKVVLSCPQNDAEKVLRDPNSPLPENAFRLSDDYDELTIIPYSI